MQRIRLLVQYRGDGFHGWQVQSKVRTVQGELQEALAQVCQRPIKLMGASRTDAGVHARGQVAAFDVEAGPRTRPRDFYRALNALTGSDLAVAKVEVVDSEFHPRHCARGKIYVYRIWDARHVDPLLRPTVWPIHGRLNVEAMRDAAPALVGEHDFTSFRGAGCDARSPVRRLLEVNVERTTPEMVEVRVVGTAFLKYMVRNIAGTLMDIGRGRRSVGSIEDILAAKDRSVAGRRADASGLTLERIFYPDFPWEIGQ